MGPFLRDLTRVGEFVEVTVVFRTTRPVIGGVHYRIAGEVDTRLSEPTPSVHHEFKLASLLPDKVYVYRILLDGKELPGGSFTTPPKPTTPVIIGVYGDTRKYDEPHAEVCKGLARRSVDLLIHTGDLVHDGFKETDWINFFRIERELLRSTPLYPVIGNHDNRGKMGRWWFEKMFGKKSKWRSITYGAVHLVILSSEGEFREQAAWLEEDLRRLRQEKPNIHYILAFIHHGPYGTGRFNGNGLVRYFFTPILNRYGPAIIFSGHEHNYERGEVDGLPFYVSGGGGAILENRRCPTKKCPAWSKIWLKIYHYIIVEAAPHSLRICVYHPNGLEVEPCIDYPIPEGVRALPPPGVVPVAEPPPEPTGDTNGWTEPAPDEPAAEPTPEEDAVPEEE